MDKKTENIELFRPIRWQQSPCATNLAIVIEELHKTLAPRKHFGIRPAIVPLWLLLTGENAPNFKTP